MGLRLGFGVVTHIDPTILLVDEILAVGDASFQLKCLDRLRQFQDDGATILMVSHALHQVRSLCSRTILIRHGVIEFDGDTETAINMHEILADSATGTRINDMDAVEIVDVHLVGAETEEPRYEFDQPVEVALRMRFTRPVDDPQIRVGIRTGDGGFGGVNVTEPGSRWRRFAEGEECDVRITFNACVAGGRYKLAFEVCERDGGGILGRYDGPRLSVAERQGISGLADIGAEVSLERL
jgi:ABC-2 type transport system ATP-binding protein